MRGEELVGAVSCGLWAVSNEHWALSLEHWALG